MKSPNYIVTLAVCACGTKTTRQFARTHEGKCPKCSKAAAGPEPGLTEPMKTKYVIRSKDSGKYIKAVGETGFTHTRWTRHATPFENLEAARAFMNKLGIYWATAIIPVHP